jgi:hypothetical protein
VVVVALVVAQLHKLRFNLFLFKLLIPFLK